MGRAGLGDIGAPSRCWELGSGTFRTGGLACWLRRPVPSLDLRSSFVRGTACYFLGVLLLGILLYSAINHKAGRLLEHS